MKCNIPHSIGASVSLLVNNEMCQTINVFIFIMKCRRWERKFIPIPGSDHLPAIQAVYSHRFLFSFILSKNRHFNFKLFHGVLFGCSWWRHRHGKVRSYDIADVSCKHIVNNSMREWEFLLAVWNYTFSCCKYTVGSCLPQKLQEPKMFYYNSAERKLLLNIGSICRK